MAYSLDKAIEAELRSLPGNNVSISTSCCYRDVSQYEITIAQSTYLPAI